MTQPDSQAAAGDGRGASEVNTLLAELGRVLKGRRFYRPGDPNLALLFERTLRVWHGDLQRYGAFEVTVTPAGLAVPDLAGGLSGQYSGLVSAFGARGVHSLRVEPDLDADAFAAFLEVLTMNPALIAGEGGFARALLARAPFGFQVNGEAAESAGCQSAAVVPGVTKPAAAKLTEPVPASTGTVAAKPAAAPAAPVVATPAEPTPAPAAPVVATPAEPTAAPAAPVVAKPAEPAPAPASPVVAKPAEPTLAPAAPVVAKPAEPTPTATVAAKLTEPVLASTAGPGTRKPSEVKPEPAELARPVPTSPAGAKRTTPPVDLEHPAIEPVPGARSLSRAARSDGAELAAPAPRLPERPAPGPVPAATPDAGAVRPLPPLAPAATTPRAPAPTTAPLAPLDPIPSPRPGASEDDMLAAAALEMAEEVFSPAAEVAPPVAASAAAPAPGLDGDDGASELTIDEEFLDFEGAELEVDEEAPLELEEGPAFASEDRAAHSSSGPLDMDTSPGLDPEDGSDGLTLDDTAPLGIPAEDSLALEAASDSGPGMSADLDSEADDVTLDDEETTFRFVDDDDDDSPPDALPESPPLDPQPPTTRGQEPGDDPDASDGLVQELLRDLEDSTDDFQYQELAARSASVAESLVEQGHGDEGFAVLVALEGHAGDEHKRSPGQRAEARQQLERLGAGAFLPALIRQACSEGEANLLATQILTQLGSEVAAPILRAAAAERSAERRGRLHGILIAMGDEALPELQRALGDEDAEGVRTAVRLAGELQNPGLVPQLDQLIERSQPSLCQEVVKALVRIGDGRAIDALITALHSASSHVPSLSAFGLGASGHPRAVNALLGAMRQAIEEGRTDFARETIRALGRLGRPEATSDLAALLLPRGFFQKRRNRDLKLAAAAALGRLPGDEAVGALAQAAQSRDAHIRRAAQIALDRRAQALAAG